MMGWNGFTERARRVVYYAQESARAQGLILVDTEHILIGILEESAQGPPPNKKIWPPPPTPPGNYDSLAVLALRECGVDLSVLRNDLQENVPRPEPKAVGDMQLGPSAKKVIHETFTIASEQRQNYVGPEHLLLGILRVPETRAARFLNHYGVSAESVLQHVQQFWGTARNEPTPQPSPWWRALFSKRRP